ncbi:MAG TPA: tripartite tricarboxylate transporter permease [Pseudolabrys sp.]|nr:tripartite tricarboxylate transporter permease [Pseudolabrys sp.]
MHDLLAGLMETLTLVNIAFIIFGVATGIIVGAIPGLNGPMAIAVALPLTYYLSPLAALAFLIGISKGSMFGGSISAILINTPGTPEAAPTAFDGYPLTQQGKGLKALKMSLFSSAIGATAGDLILFFTAAPAAILALMMGPAEMTAVLLFSFTIIAGLAGKSPMRGCLAAIFGVFLSVVGLDPESTLPRLTFGSVQLQDGIPLIPLTIGLLALSEILLQIEDHLMRGDASGRRNDIFSKDAPRENRTVTRADWRSCARTIWRSSLIGIGIGALPGVGAVVAGFLGYASAKRNSPNGDKFGTGQLEGVAATEAANNAVTGSALIPLLAIGIPGNLTATILIGAFLIHGVQPGPLIFKEHGALVYGLFGAMALADLFTLTLGAVGLRLFSLVLNVPNAVLYPVIVLLCMAGAYSSDNSMFGVAIALIFAVLGYLMRKLDFSFATFLIGFALGRQFELFFRQSLILFRDSPAQLLHHPIAIAFVLLTIVSLWRIGRKKPAAGAQAEPSPSFAGAENVQ